MDVKRGGGSCDQRWLRCELSVLRLPAAQNRTVKDLGIPEVRVTWLHSALMGGFWFGGLAVYGLGIYRIGDFGTAVGWPLLMGTIIVTSNAAGFLTAEWAGTGARVRGYLGAESDHPPCIVDPGPKALRRVR